MAGEATNQLSSLHFRARLPKYFRVGAIILFALTIIVVGIGYYRARSNTDFRMKAFPTALSKDVVALVSGYERRESEGDVPKYFIKADTATTFSDNHQELENVYLQVFGEGNVSDEITAQKAIYIPEENKNFTGYFAGNVLIKTRDSLSLRTQQVIYKKVDETATADEHVEFERFNLKGSSFGASLNIPTKSVTLDRDVNFELLRENGETAKLSAGTAVYDHSTERIDLTNGAHFEVQEPDATRSDGRANHAVASLQAVENVRTLDRIELFDEVQLNRTEGDKVVAMRARRGAFYRLGLRYELEQEVSIESAISGNKVNAFGASAVYESAALKITLSGDARIDQNTDYAQGDRIIADLFPSNALSDVTVTGNGHLHQTNSDSVIDMNSSNLKATFGEDGVISHAASSGQCELVSSSNDNARFSIGAVSGMFAKFRGTGTVDEIQTDGRTTIKLEVPDNGSDSADQTVAADVIHSQFQADGKNLKHTEAIGNAVFTVAPHRASTTNFNTKIEVPRFDCDFFTGANNPRICSASASTKTTRTPTVAREGRGEQTIETDKLSALFDQSSGNIVQFDARGRSRFSELDKKALADSFNYTTSDEVVRLRGGEPTAWDSRARIKAKEIDWDIRNSRSYFRKSVNTTYYSPKGMRNSAPFGDEGKPVYITSETAELDHANESAVYSGNARGWQGGNYVRAETINIRQKESQLSATGNVQSLLYQVKKPGESSTSTPVFAAANEMYYDGNARTIRYVRAVDIRQGQDRITGASALIYLNEGNELVRTDAETGVTIVQSGRKAFADLAVYTAADDKLLLRGRPARVEDLEKGTAQGEELVIFLNDNRVSGEGKSKVNPSGRVRSSYKVK